MDLIIDIAFESLIKIINIYSSYQPLFLIATSALVTHILHISCRRIPKSGIKSYFVLKFFKILRKLPFIKTKIDKEIFKAKESLENDVAKLYTKAGEKKCVSITQLPTTGLENKDIIQKTKEYLQLGPYVWEDGKCSGAVYHGGSDLTKLFTDVFELTMWTNPLHMNVFPGICKMEAEIVRMSAQIFGGNDKTCGSVTSGGTESLLLAVKVYRDYAREIMGINEPEILVPTTAHAAFDKAAQFLDIKIKKVPVDGATFKVDIAKMKKMINRNTCMLVGSAPGYPHGCMDDIEEIAQLGNKYKIPVHVDACLGGFLIAFMEKAGYSLKKPYDFRVNGVTSISADTHKYGNAPKGTSVLLFSDLKFKHFQYFVETNWSGGIYASPSLAGSRSGALIAECWASFLKFGQEGYIESTRKIIEAAKIIINGTKNIHGVEILGDPETSIIAWKSDFFDIYRLQDSMTSKGWQLNALQFPPSIHFCVAYCNTQSGVPEKFVNNFRSSVDVIMKNPKKMAAGAAAIYGSTQKIPDRSLVSEITASYLDKLYQTEFESVK